jgi:hypothetical protein
LLTQFIFFRNQPNLVFFEFNQIWFFLNSTKFAVTWLRAKVAGKMQRGKCAMRANLRAMRANLRAAVVQQPMVRCLTGYCCSVCKPDYILVMVMGLHQRLGQQSPVSVLTGELVNMIMEMTKSRKKLPAWLSCSWNLNFAKKRQARAVLECSRAAKRKREDEMD